jgi:hypothetical protein
LHSEERFGPMPMFSLSTTHHDSQIPLVPVCVGKRLGSARASDCLVELCEEVEKSHQDVVMTPGVYEVTLRQWPAEASKPIVAVRAKVKIAGKELEKPVQKDRQGVDFELKFQAGRSELWTYLYDDHDNAGGAYFTAVEALESKSNWRAGAGSSRGNVVELERSLCSRISGSAGRWEGSSIVRRDVGRL